jgi:hypothetical protein
MWLSCAIQAENRAVSSFGRLVGVAVVEAHADICDLGSCNSRRDDVMGGGPRMKGICSGV